MKRLLLIVVCIVAITFIKAQTPLAFSYKALIQSKNGIPVINKKVAVKISILQENINGIAVYIERHITTTSILGTIDIVIGRGTPTLGLFTNINWAESPYFLKSEVDIKGGTTYQLIGVSELLSVPYALYAEKVANEFSGNYNDLSDKPKIPTNLSELNNDAWYIQNGAWNVNIGPNNHVFWATLDVGGPAYFEPGQLTWGSWIQLDASTLSGGLSSTIVSTGGDAQEGPGKLLIYHGSDGRKEGIVIDKDSKIGIGTSYPSAKLQVSNGDIYIENVNSGVIMKSPDASCWRMTVNDAGQPVFTKITCPVAN